MNMRLLIGTCLAVVIMAANGLSAQTVEYPGREYPSYRNVPYIEREALYQQYLRNAVVIVDVRSKLEYDTIHIEGAVHIPLTDSSFEAQLRILANTSPGMPISFYCNGTTCFKSYEAQIRATEAGIEPTFAFDLGIPGWAEHYPEHTLLLGTPLSKSAVKWIPDEALRAKMLSWEEFRAAASHENAHVFDVRDAIQKGEPDAQSESELTAEQQQVLAQFQRKNEAMLAELGTVHAVIAQPVDTFIKRVVDKGLLRDSTLLILDQVGKQVRWLMYYLEAAGYTDYYFLADGAYGVLGIQAYSE